MMTRTTDNKGLVSILIFIIAMFVTASSQAQLFLTNGLVAYYPFAGNANDISGRGHNGNNNGAVLTTDRFGITNAAYYFNGAANIDIATSTDFKP